MSTFERVQKIISTELKVDLEKVTLEADLEKDLGADSLDAVEVIMALEEEFGLSIDDESAQEIRKVSDLVDYIEKHQ